MDLNSEHFKNMPLKEKYDLLVELKETRKMNSWGRLHELPKKSDSFSDFQVSKVAERKFYIQWPRARIFHVFETYMRQKLLLFLNYFFVPITNIFDSFLSLRCKDC